MTVFVKFEKNHEQNYLVFIKNKINLMKREEKTKKINDIRAA